MQSFSNIEQSMFRGSATYIGYADGAWRILKNEGGGWNAYKRDGAAFLHGATLAAVSDALTKYAEQAAITARIARLAAADEACPPE